ncbi:MAG: S8 family serine peptidase, partial [Arenicella sp.]|nr:S8 family serine peptidase [Arenicella sp.]
MRIKPNVQLKKITAVMLGVYAIGVGHVNAQQIAILDSGVDPQPGFNLVQGFDYFNNVEDTTDKSGEADDVEAHGTATVRLATESFSGEIVPFVITDGSSVDVDQVQVRTARDSALSDILGRSSVRVIGITNNSLGVTNSSAPLISNLSGADKVIAITAGDGGSTQPNALSTSSFNLSGVVIVGATDASGELLAGSNQAGTTSNKYVAVNGLIDGDSSATEGGTSYATARLSGIAGAVLLQNPNLTAEEVVEVILISAEDRGEDGTDSVYGRGVILNAQQVLNNVIGPVVVPTPPVTPTPAPSS